MLDLNGNGANAIQLADLGTASGFGGSPGDPETFYSFTSFNRPPSIYRLNLETGETDIFASPELTFAPEDFAIEQKFYQSKDGTRIPMLIVRKKELAESGEAAPTLLYGYGGFDISITPGFNATRMA